MIHSELLQLYSSFAGNPPAGVTHLGAAGSNRSYFRFIGTNGETLIGASGTSHEENQAFLTIGRHLRQQGLPVPQIFAVSPDGMHYLQQDLGNESLFAMLDRGRSENGFSATVTTMLERTVALLPRIQFLGGQGLDTTVCYPCPAFDRTSIMWDLNYFKYCYLKGCGIDFHEARLETDFSTLATLLLADAPYQTFMFRDFQSRNVMIMKGEPWFIDFQGGRLGPIEYDLVSFIYQARAGYPESVRNQLVNVYLDALAPYRRVDPDSFALRLKLFALFRMLQVLGAYGYRGYFERKPQFLQSIPAALAALRDLAPVISDSCPYLAELITALWNSTTKSQPDAAPHDILTIHVSSFSYRKGIPYDTSGNGGGFVFDCRGLRNPGKFDQYKTLTGLDAPVIEYLEAQGEIQPFLRCCSDLVLQAVDKYLSRGFTSLTVNFGCTGGHHRSVYSASHMATALKQHYGDSVRVVLEHRELQISEVL